MVFRNSTHASLPGKILGCGHLFALESNFCGCLPRPCLQKILGHSAVLFRKNPLPHPYPIPPPPTAMAHRITLSALESITGGVSPRKIPARSKPLCHIFPDLFLFFPTLGCGVHIFNSIPRNKILEKNLLRLLGVDVRSDTLGFQKNNLLVVCRLII